MQRYVLLSVLIGLALTSGAPPRAEAQTSASVLVDDYVPQPLQGNSSWFYNRLGGDRGEIGGPGSATAGARYARRQRLG
jgi:hypothetical protein